MPSYGQAEVALWEGKVRARGHDADDPDDPVSAQWRNLRRDQGPASEFAASLHEDVYREIRTGRTMQRLELAAALDEAYPQRRS